MMRKRNSKAGHMIHRILPLFLLCALLLGAFLPAVWEPQPAFAASEEEQEAGGEAEEERNTEAGAGEGAEENAEQLPNVEVKPLTGADKFRMFLCCVFGVGVCLAAALWGDPRERLKDKYKRARKQQALEEKRQKEREKKLEKKKED